MICKLELVVVAIRRTKLNAVVVVVDHASIMLIVDIPIDAEHVLLISLCAIGRQTTWIVVVNIFGNAFDAIMVFFAEPWALDAIV